MKISMNANISNMQIFHKPLGLSKVIYSFKKKLWLRYLFYVKSDIIKTLHKALICLKIHFFLRYTGVSKKKASMEFRGESFSQ